MEEPLRDWIVNEHHVTWGTCAGMILLSKVMENQKQGGQTSVSAFFHSVLRPFQVYFKSEGGAKTGEPGPEKNHLTHK